MAEKTLEEMRQAVAEIREKMAAAPGKPGATRQRCSSVPPARPAQRTLLPPVRPCH